TFDLDVSSGGRTFHGEGSFDSSSVDVGALGALAPVVRWLRFYTQHEVEHIERDRAEERAGFRVIFLKDRNDPTRPEIQVTPGGRFVVTEHSANGKRAKLHYGELSTEEREALERDVAAARAAHEGGEPRARTLVGYVVDVWAPDGGKTARLAF